MKKLRVGVIGLGMGRWHIRAYGETERAEVVAIADMDKDRLARTGDEYGISKRYRSGEDMVEKEALDIVDVVTPNATHRPLTIAALESGAHVLCEKPLAMSAAEAQEMVDAAKRLNRRLMVNFSFRFTPQSWALKTQVDKGMLGEPYFASTTWLRRRGLPGFGGWFGTKEKSGGGALIDLGVHRLDLALWFMGYPEPEWVMAGTYDHLGKEKAKREKKVFNVEDLATAMIRFENGSTLQLAVSWAGNIKEKELIETRVLGTKGGLIQRNVNEGYEFDAEYYIESDGYLYNVKPHPPFPGAHSAMQHFADCVADNKPHIATGEEGVTVMRLLDAIYASARQGTPVKLDQV